MNEVDEMRRQAARARSAAWRRRKSRGALVIPVEVAPSDLAGLERLALLPVGERDPQVIGKAVVQFLAAARPLAAVGDALWPAEAEPRA
jgi:hypothetical protein